MNFGDPRLPDRFWIKTIPEPNSGCWLWLASVNMQGYGRYGVRALKLRPRSGYMGAHHFAYIMLVGDVPSGFELDHLCRTPICVHPMHLEPVTHRINMLRGDTFAADQASRTACPAGHPYDDANTVIRHGSRCCRTCERNRERRSRTKAS